MNSKKSVFKGLFKAIGNEYASVAEDGVSGDVTTFIDTGNYALNALLSGTIFGGVPSNRVVGFAGEEATGKTFFLLSIVKNFLHNNPDATVLYFETEHGLDSQDLKRRGIDVSRFVAIPVATVEDVRTQVVKAIKWYVENFPDRPPILFCLDSLGQLTTNSEVEDAESGENKSDMGRRAKLIKGVFRVLSMKLGKENIPLIMTNHTYESMNPYSGGPNMSGGQGLKYAASTILFLRKKKDRDSDKNVVGNVITCETVKSRLSRPNQKIDVKLSFDRGLERYSGLADIAVRAGVWSKPGKTSKFIILPDGEKKDISVIEENPETYFTEDVLKKIDEGAKSIFRYGLGDAE